MDFIVHQLAAAGVVRARKMFGDYAVYCDEKVVALISDDRLFVKPTATGGEFLGPCPQGSPYPGAKPCFVISEDRWEDGVWLSKLIALTAAELPYPKPRAAAATKSASGGARGKKTSLRPKRSA